MTRVEPTRFTAWTNPFPAEVNEEAAVLKDYLRTVKALFDLPEIGLTDRGWYLLTSSTGGQPEGEEVIILQNIHNHQFWHVNLKYWNYPIAINKLLAEAIPDNLWYLLEDPEEANEDPYRVDLMKRAW